MLKRLLIPITISLLAFLGIWLTRSDNEQIKTNEETKKSYVAIGDSVSAGVGLPDPSDSSACDRTNQSYPNLLAENNKFALTNISCSSATITNGINGPQVVNRLQLESQIDQLTKLPKTDIITITIGANDAKWTNILRRCYLSECGTTSDNTEINNNLKSISINLKAALDKIKNIYKDSSSPQIIITGYYQIFPEKLIENCNELSGITNKELIWGRKYINDLNQVIKDATSQYPTINYTEINFNSHELCTADSWIQNFNDKQPYHPNEKGQQNIAKQIETIIYK